LREANSLFIVGDSPTKEHLEINAHGVVERASKVLRGEEKSLLAVEEEIYRNIEAAEEPLNPHPDEPFRAGWRCICSDRSRSEYIEVRRRDTVQWWRLRVDRGGQNRTGKRSSKAHTHSDTFSTRIS